MAMASVGSQRIIAFVVLAIPIMVWPQLNVVIELPLRVLFALMAIGLAIEITELLLAIVWRPYQIPSADSPGNPAATAVVMTVCDDWDDAALNALLPPERPVTTSTYSTIQAHRHACLPMSPPESSTSGATSDVAPRAGT